MVKPLILYSGVRPDSFIKRLFTQRVDAAIKDYEFNTAKNVASPLYDVTDSIIYLVSYKQIQGDVRGGLATLYSNNIATREWFAPLVFLVYGSPHLQIEEFSSGVNGTLPTERLLPIKVVHTSSMDRQTVYDKLEPCLDEVIKRHLRLRYLAFKTSTFSSSHSHPIIHTSTPSSLSLSKHELEPGKSSIVIHNSEYGMLILSDQGVDEADVVAKAATNPDTHVPIVGTITCDQQNEITTVYGPFSKRRISVQSYDKVLVDDDELIENMDALVSLYSYTFVAGTQRVSKEADAYTLSRDIGVTDLNSFLHSLLACDEWKGLYNASKSALSTGAYNASLYSLLQENSSKVELCGLIPTSVLNNAAGVVQRVARILEKEKSKRRKVDQDLIDGIIANANGIARKCIAFNAKTTEVYLTPLSSVTHNQSKFDATVYTVDDSTNHDLYRSEFLNAVHPFVHFVDYTKTLDDIWKNRHRMLASYNKSKQAFLQLCYIEYIGRYCYLNSSSSQNNKETAASMALTLNDILNHWKGFGKGEAVSSSSSSKIGSLIPDRTKLVIRYRPIPVHLYGIDHLQGVVRELVYDQDPSSSSAGTGPRVILPSHKPKTKSGNGFDLSKALDSVKTGSDVDLTNTLVTWYTAKLLLQSEYAKRTMSPSKRVKLHTKFEHVQDELSKCVRLH